MMTVTLFDVFLRYLFNSPIRYSYDLVESTLVVFVFNAMSTAFLQRRNIVIDLIDSFAHRKVVTALIRLSDVLAVMTLALFAMGGIYLWDQLPDATAMEPAAKSWTQASRSAPAFAVSQTDSHDKTVTYEALRHPQGGRKDVFHWVDQDKTPIAELEIYRPGREDSETAPAAADIAARLDPGAPRNLEAAGMIDSKFGTVTLLRLVGGADTRACLGFVKRVDEPNVRISGWSCQSDNMRDNLPARRATIACMLNRLTLLSAGNDPKLAELFARAELRRVAETALRAWPH